MSETRALSAALSGPAFNGAASRSALHTSERHVERYAPEGAASRRGGMGSLAFADHVAGPWMSSASMSRATQMFSSYAGGAHNERSVPGTSWLFPRPWFHDELDWMASARVGLETSAPRGALSTRGTYIPSTSSSSSSGFEPNALETERGQAWSNVSMPVLSPDVMATVAPSMRGSAGARSADPTAPMQRNLRAWSPSVDFHAAAAAEVVMGAMSSVTAAGLPGLAERSPIWSGLAVVTPQDLGQAQREQLQRGTAADPMSAGPRAGLSRPTASSSSAPAPIELSAPTAVDTARDSISRIEHRLEELRYATPAAAEAAESPAAPSVAAPIATPLSTGEQQLATAARSSSAVAQALRTVELLLGAAAPQRASSPIASTAAPSTAAPSFDATGALIAPAAAELVAPSMMQHFAPIAGPRVTMPAGLGGLVTSLETSRSVARPMSRTAVEESMSPYAVPAFARGPISTASLAAAGAAAESATAAESPRGASFSPVWAQAPSAFASVASHGARAVDHLSWSDRWLARFAGASPLALSAFDATRAAAEPTLRPLSAGSPEIVYIQPQLTARAVTEAGWAARTQPTAAATASRPTPSSSGALRIDDNERVSDDVFAAIAAASVSQRAPQRPMVAPAAAATARAEQARIAELQAELAATGATPTAAAGATRAAQAPSVIAPVDLLRASGRTSIADLVSIAVPSAPDAGVSAGLASSPMAPALSSLLPLPNAPVFDPRALQGAGLSEAYLGGFLARAALPVGVISGAPTASALAAASAPSIGAHAFAMEAWTRRDLALAPTAMRLASAAPDREFIAGGGDVDVTMRGSRGAAPLFASGVSTPAAQAAAVQAAERQAVERQSAIAQSAPATELLRGDAAETFAPATATTEPAPMRAALEAELVALRAALLAGPDASSVPLAHAEQAPLMASMTSVPSASHAQIPSLGGVVQGASSPMAASLARTAMASFAQPGDVAMPAAAAGPAMHAPTIAAAGGRPGSLAEATLAWSINEERAASNLSFDFVTPELLLAAKVYGLSPGAAAEAMRMASAGPSAMSSLATALDLTFLRAFQASPAGAARSQEGLAYSAPSMTTLAPIAGAAIQRSAAPGGAAAPSAAAPSFAAPSATAPGAVDTGAFTAETAAAIGAPAATAMAASGSPAIDAPRASTWSAGAASPESYAPSAAMPASSPRLPRGAFLWPPGAVAALGLRALSAEGYAGLPVVALELLAAQAVAELGTWVTAFPSAAKTGQAAGDADEVHGFTPGTRGLPFVTAAGQREQPGVTVDAAGRPLPSLAAAVAASQSGAPTSATAATAPEEAADAATWYASSLPAGAEPARARFQSVYLALSQSAEGQSLSPSVRAARVMSLLARGDDSQQLTTRERAQAAWSMLPNVYDGGLDVVAGSRAAAAELAFDNRPGLGGLAARAGDALSSFVNPTAAAVQGLSRSGDAAALPSAARVADPVYVQNNSSAPPQSMVAPRAGRTFSQVGGGETEIPSWFEDAARRMFEGGASKGDTAMSLAQMVLVTAMPTQQVAAATKSVGGAGSAPGAAGGGKAAGGTEKPDVDQLALEVFHEVMKLIEIARERSGDPFQ